MPLRSSRQELFCEKDVLRNFIEVTGKHLCQSLFFNKAAGLRPQTLAQVFSCEFCEISKNTFSYRTRPVAASEGLYQIPIRIGLDLGRKISTKIFFVLMQKNRFPIIWNHFLTKQASSSSKSIEYNQVISFYFKFTG